MAAGLGVTNGSLQLNHFRPQADQPKECNAVRDHGQGNIKYRDVVGYGKLPGMLRNTTRKSEVIITEQIEDADDIEGHNKRPEERTDSFLVPEFQVVEFSRFRLCDRGGGFVKSIRDDIGINEAVVRPGGSFRHVVLCPVGSYSTRAWGRFFGAGRTKHMPKTPGKGAVKRSGARKSEAFGTRQRVWTLSEPFFPIIQEKLRGVSSSMDHCSACRAGERIPLELRYATHRGRLSVRLLRPGCLQPDFREIYRPDSGTLAQQSQRPECSNTVQGIRRESPTTTSAWYAGGAPSIRPETHLRARSGGSACESNTPLPVKDDRRF